ncbi:hypothetical protein BASA81_001897 [Batrachochytrium salamandrivorans]|nr:hypothetical protein BASA81_001897 [Batrachochytrium salamandrivorans]
MQAFARSRDSFLHALERLMSSQPTSSLGEEGILSIHGSRLGNLEPLSSTRDFAEEALQAEFESTARREKALYDVQVALTCMEEALSTYEQQPEQEEAITLCRKIASGLAIDTSPELLLLYHSVLTVNLL